MGGSSRTFQVASSHDRPLEKGWKGSRMRPVTLLLRCGNREIAVSALARALNCSRTEWCEAENPFWGALGSSAASQADIPDLA